MNSIQSAFVVGEPAPWFRIPSERHPSFNFNTLAGRHVILCFLESLNAPYSQAIMNDFVANQNLFDVTNAAVVIVSTDPNDEQLKRYAKYSERILFFWDFSRKMSERFGPAGGSTGLYARQTMIFDERLRFLFSLPIKDDQHVHQVEDALLRLTRPTAVHGHAPVLYIPRVFEPEFCRTLIRYYHQNGASVSGFMEQQGGKTVPVIDNKFKSRRDCTILDPILCNQVREDLQRKVIPEVLRSFQFQCKYLERYIVACYDANEGGKFGAHRDNSTTGTRHRKFAVTINLNAEDYEGGDLRFREFGMKTYRAPTGGAIVFSCSLLHEALPIKRGTRYACLPFLYDEAGAAMRETTKDTIVSEIEYRTATEAISPQNTM